MTGSSKKPNQVGIVPMLLYMDIHGIFWKFKDRKSAPLSCMSPPSSRLCVTVGLAYGSVVFPAEQQMELTISRDVHEVQRFANGL